MTYVILILVLILIYLVVDIKNPKEEKETTKKNTYSSYSSNKNYKKYYRPKRYVISYNVLTEIANELNLTVFSQVSLYNIVETLPNLDYKTKRTYFNQISQKSIDFVLVDKNDCRIKLCIELDDSTHQQKNRIERDKFINELFRCLEINLLRYPVYKNYYKDTLKKRIEENMKEHYYQN